MIRFVLLFSFVLIGSAHAGENACEPVASILTRHPEGAVWAALTILLTLIPATKIARKYPHLAAVITITRAWVGDIVKMREELLRLGKPANGVPPKE